jgi:hypothetical protein
MHDEKTPGQNYPLPHHNNALADDVSRIRAALTLIDGDIGQAATQQQQSIEQQQQQSMEQQQTAEKLRRIKLNNLLGDQLLSI